MESLLVIFFSLCMIGVSIWFKVHSTRQQERYRLLFTEMQNYKDALYKITSLVGEQPISESNSSTYKIRRAVRRVALDGLARGGIVLKKRLQLNGN